MALLHRTMEDAPVSLLKQGLLCCTAASWAQPVVAQSAEQEITAARIGRALRQEDLPRRTVRIGIDLNRPVAARACRWTRSALGKSHLPMKTNSG
jgi:hypothetical protein